MSETTTTQEQQQPGLTVQDLTLALQVIQVATSRGAFKADELSAIGGLYDRVFKFLEAAGHIQRNDAEVPAENQTAEAPAANPAPVAKAAAAKTKKAK